MMKETLQNNDNIVDQFAQLQNKNEIAEVLKELFDNKKIEMITDISKDEAKIMTRIYMISKIKNVGIWEQGLTMYAKLMLSKDRKSRRELIDAIRGASKPEGFMGRFKNMIGGGY